ncbi:CD177 antigen-like [Pelodiscus sinensis]|uniref:CD177 antigen-like n=1 Tax=Pelodiscus sinensis TaxID=13735 RepID=UPI003F6AC6C4
MTVSLAACLLAALLGTGAGLQCEVCAAMGQNCSGSLQPCPAGQDSCGIFLIEVTQGEIKSQGILKSCVTPSLCTAGPISVRFGTGMTRTGIACCTGDACRTVNVTLPPPDTEPNGRLCPACFSAPPAPCREETVSCIGSETQCLEAAGTINMGERPFKFTMKGCASESAWDQFQVGSGTFVGSNVTLTAAKCSDGPGGGKVPLTVLRSCPGSATSHREGAALGLARLLPALAGLLLWLLSGEIKSQTILKSCVMPSQCTAGPSSVHFGMGMTRTGVACCTGDSCRTVNVTLPPPDTKPNGRRCPACFSVFAGQCSEKIVSCTGSEFQCIESAGTVNMGQSSLQTVMKGCASESACAQLKVDPGTIAGSSVTVTTAKCTAASSAMGLALGLAGHRPAS